jgi:hypothetical protein
MDDDQKPKGRKGETAKKKGHTYPFCALRFWNPDS